MTFLEPLITICFNIDYFFISVSPTSSENVRISNSSFSPNSSSQQSGASRNNGNSTSQLINNNSPTQQQHIPVSQTLSDLKKQRSLSRAVHQQQNSPKPQQQHREEGENASGSKKRSPEKHRRSSNNNKRDGNSSGGRRRNDEHAESGPPSIDVLKFSATTGEVVGPPKKTSCCKVMWLCLFSQCCGPVLFQCMWSTRIILNVLTQKLTSRASGYFTNAEWTTNSLFL